MKQVFKIAPLALAVAALSFTGAVAASGNGDRGGYRGGDGATLKKYVKVSKDVDYKGDVRITGTIRVNSLGMAVIDDEQDSDHNKVHNDQVDNTADFGDDSLRNSKGNIGVNISAGDNNVQGNSAALAAADAAFIFGSADAEIFVDQNADDNYTMSYGTRNNATMGEQAMMNARGNLGVNITSGSGNVQKNAFAGAVASGSMGEATVQVRQETEHNETHNHAQETFEVLTTDFEVGGSMNGGYIGAGAGRYSGTNGPATYRGTNGPATYNGVNGPATYSGTSTQNGGVYPEIWMDDGDHNSGDPAVLWGHLDFDDQNGNGQGNLKGTFDFDESGTISSSRERGRIGPSSERGTVGPSRESGSLGFVEAGVQSLSGVLTGSAQHVVSRYIRHKNNADLGDNALRGARGNIGVNISAGTNNLQNNSLAISRVNAPAAGGEGGGTGGGE